MSADTVLYRDAVLLVGGASLAGQFNDLNVNYASEMLDRTAFGDTTRNRRGGLFVASIDGKGMSVSGANLVEDVLFTAVGLTTESVAVVVFPNGVTEGSQVARGYAMMGVVEHLKVGGQAGVLLPFDVMINGAGLG